MTDSEPTVTRRSLLRASAGAGAAVAGASALGGTAAAQDVGVDEWLSAVSNYDGVVDETGSDEVTVEVGVQANDGPYGFGPAAVRVDPGATVNFEWVSNTHNVVVESQPDDADWSGDEEINNEGYSYSNTFETPGVYTYYCQPHLSVGMKGAIVVGAAPGGGGDGGPTGQRATLGSTLWTSAFAGSVLLAMLAPIAASYYRNRPVPEADRLDTDDEQQAAAIPEADPYEPETELGHDEY